MKYTIIVSTVILTALFTACGNNPSEPEQWPDGAYLYLAGSYSDTSLAWSPYGNVLLFSSYDGTSPSIYGFDGLVSPVLMTSSNQNESVGPTGCWSATEGMILFTAFSGTTNSDIRTVPGNLGYATVILSDGLKHLHPTWSPNSDSLLFCTYSDNYWGLWKAEYDEDSITTDSFYTPSFDCLRPSYSPDGQWILFQVNDGSQSDIWLIRPDGSEPHAVITGNSDDIHPCWGPENDWFAFSSDRSGQWDIWISDLDGNELVQITDDPGKDIYPAWNPGSGWFAFSSDREGGSGNYDIFSIDAPAYKGATH